MDYTCSGNIAETTDYSTCTDSKQMLLGGGDTFAPSVAPSVVPSAPSTTAPSTRAPSTRVPSVSPTVSPAPSVAPSIVQTVSPTTTPSFAPSAVPSAVPSVPPTVFPTAVPSTTPTVTPTAVPSPTLPPTASPTGAPTVSPTVNPTKSPTAIPTAVPSQSPTLSFAPTAGHLLTLTGDVSLNNIDYSAFSASEKNDFLEGAENALESLWHLNDGSVVVTADAKTTRRRLVTNSGVVLHFTMVVTDLSITGSSSSSGSAVTQSMKAEINTHFFTALQTSVAANPALQAAVGAAQLQEVTVTERILWSEYYDDYYTSCVGHRLYCGCCFIGVLLTV
jgi:hypothetical protein